MFIHRQTGTKFKNRKDAVIIMGESRYKRFLKQGEFIFPNYSDGAKCREFYGLYRPQK